VEQAIEPHFFGSAEKQLLGIYHAPHGRARAHGVVLCHSAPQEYMRTHMAFRKLAAMLAREGFHVLRFDYYGTGDSAGGSHDGSLTQWTEDIATAVEDLKDASGAINVSLIGFRIGATLAALAPVTVSSLVLWEPVVSGRRYLHELRAIHEHRFSNLLFPPRLPRNDCGGELLGFPLPLEMEADIRALDLGDRLGCQAEQIVLAVSKETPEYAILRSKLQARGFGGDANFEYHHVPDESGSENSEAMLLSTKVLQVIASTVSRRAG
jgi:pimeloyl-ACP methyl ester carboxylesterase